MLGYDESKEDFRTRTRIIVGVIVFLFCALIGKLFMLQVYDSGKYALMSDKNRIRLSPILPKRGRIFSADGKILAGNRSKYKLVLEACGRDRFLKNIDLLGSCLNLTEVERSNLLEIRKKVPMFAHIVVDDDLSWDEYAKIAMVFYQFSDVFVESVFIRDYLYPAEFSHLLGYTAKSKDAIQILVGKTGIEASMNDDLVGDIGNLQTEINAMGKRMRIINSADAINGKDIILSINSDLQKYIYDLVSKEKAGACVVLDITSGEVLALVSVPGFDANLMSSKITKKQWNNIVADPLNPLINRAISGTYPPGSIFKIVVAFAALSEHVISEHDRVFCAGSVKLDDSVFHCWNRYGHGYVDVYDAIRMSCDCYFFDVARRLGIDTIVKYAKKFGFGEATGIELPNENSGLLPTKKWKILRYGNSWKPYETMIVGIGQGALLSTLIQAATMFGKLYTGNFCFAPTVIKNNRSGSSKIDPVDKKYAEIIRKALYQVCNSSGGTAIWSCRADYGISGKTGSSQVRKIRASDAGKSQKTFEWKHRDHAFFVGCAPFQNPRYVVAVLIEHGGGGASVAAPIARSIFDKLLGK